MLMSKLIYYDNQILLHLFNITMTMKHENLPSYDEYKDKEINYLNKFIINQNNTKIKSTI